MESQSVKIPDVPISSRFYYPAFAILLAAGFLIRINQLGAGSLWIDEAFTGFLALTTEWFSYVRHDNAPPLYYLLQRGWCGLMLCDEAGIRMTSVIAGTLFIVLTGRFCEQLYGRKTALIMLAIVVVSPLHFYYSQEARVYSALMTALLWFLYLQWQVLEKEATVIRSLLLFVASVIALYLHYFSVLLIGLCLCVYLIEQMRGVRKVPRRYYLAVTGSLLLVLPWMFFNIFGVDSVTSEMDWVGQYLADKPVWQLPARTLMVFLNGPLLYEDEMNLFVKRYSFADISTAFHGIYYGLAALFTGFYLVLWIGAGWLSAASRRIFMESSVFFFGPILLLILLSIVIQPAYVVGRYDLVAYPGFIMLLATVLHAVVTGRPQVSAWRPSIVIVGILFVVLLMGYRLFLYKRTPPYDEVRTDIAAITDTLADGDGLLIASPNAALYWYYLHLQGYDRDDGHCIGGTRTFVCRLVPENLEQAPALQQRYFDLYETGNAAGLKIDYFLDALSPAARVVLIVDQVSLEQGSMELDPIGFRIATVLGQAGYKMDAVDTERRMLKFIPSG